MIDVVGTLTTSMDDVCIKSVFDNLDVDEIETTHNGNHIFEISGCPSAFGYEVFTKGLLSITDTVFSGHFECAYPCLGEENDFWKIEFNAKSRKWFVYDGYKAYKTDGVGLNTIVGDK